MRIDVHAHYFPTPYLDRMHRLGAEYSNARHAALCRETQADIDGRLENMDRAGVDIQVLSVSATFPFFEDKAEAVDAAHEANDLFVDLIARYPKRFKGFVAVPLPHVDEALKELERGIDQLGMVGATIGTSVLTHSAADPAFEPFYAELNRRKAVLFIHPHFLGMCSPFITNHGLTGVIGAPMEDIMFAIHMIQRGIPIRYPDIKIIVPHLGGGLPMLLSRIDSNQKMWAEDNPELPSVTARRMWYDTVAQGNIHALRCAHQWLGTDRLLHGSDYPFQLHDRYVNSVTYVQEALPKAESAQILDHNAARLLGLEK